MSSVVLWAESNCVLHLQDKYITIWINKHVLGIYYYVLYNYTGHSGMFKRLQ